MRLLDVRHEQTAVFAAEATGKLTRRPGLAVLTAGPGVTNGVSAIDQRQFNGSPLVVVGGRAPDYRWGTGSLQELDQPPLLAPVTKRAATVHAVERAGRRGRRGVPAGDGTAPRTGLPRRADGPAVQPCRRRAAGPAGPAADGTGPRRPGGGRRAARSSRATRCWCSAPTCGPTAPRTPRSGSSRPPASRSSPTGWAAVCSPRGHPLLVTRRGAKRSGSADLVVVVGTPLDFRLGYGTFGGKDGAPAARVVHLADSPGQSRGTRRAGRLRHRRPRRWCSRASSRRWKRHRAPDRVRRVDRPAAGHRPRRGRRRPRRAGQRRRPDPPGPDLRRADPGDWPTTPWSSATAATSCRSPASTSSPRRPAAGSTPGPTAASAPGSATPSPPGWPGPSARSCCCSATARPASR